MNCNARSHPALARLGAAALVLGLALLWAVPADAAPGGSISGTVVAAADGAPLPGICVSAGNGPGAVTDSLGGYSMTGLDPGTYTVQYWDCSAVPSYVGQWYLGHPDSSSADKVTVIADTDTALTDVALAAGVSVSGTVTDVHGDPISGISVNVNPVNAGQSTGTTTANDGTYVTSPLPPGDYKVQFADNNADPTWAREYWDGAFSWNTAAIVTLQTSSGPVRSGIDAQLDAAAQVSGTVTDPDGGALQGVCVNANVASNGGWDWVNGATTAADGSYTITQLPSTDVRVAFHDCATGQYTDQWYDNANSVQSSTPIVLTPGEARTGVDARLGTGIAVSGRVTDSDGNPLQGINVWVNPTGQGSGTGAQTDADGEYTTSALAPGDYRVQFSANGPDPEWATQFWSAQPSWNTATSLTLAASDAPARTGVDAELTRAATVSGTVTNEAGTPVPGVCVTAVIETPGGLDGTGNATTDADGNYAIKGLAVNPVKIYFQDCQQTGPYIDQWWDARPDPSSATVITPVAGETTTGIDAHLQPAGVIRGHVTDTGGNPLGGICAQATSDGWFGGLAQTDQNGDYAITIGRSGAYRVQFVDCTDNPAHAGQWWDHASSAATASIVTVTPGDTVTGVDAELAAGTVGTISGRIVNLQGSPMTTACVVAYLPDRYALVAPVNPDGTYLISGIPSGTYALAALGCGSGNEPSPVLPDPDTPNVNYTGMWWDAIPLHFDQATQGGPDPIAQGATLVTIAPGANATDHDFCFGCTAIAISDVTPGSESVTVSFTTPGLASPDVVTTATGLEDALTYSATCTSSTGGAPGTAISTHTDAITVSGLTAGATYSCVVTASHSGVAVASSAPSAGLTLAGGSVAPTSAPVTAPLAFTGSSSITVLSVAGLLLVVLGLIALAATRRGMVTTPSTARR